MFARFQREISALLTEAVEICYYMRGGISYEQVLLRSAFEREKFMTLLTTLKEQGRLV